MDLLASGKRVGVTALSHNPARVLGLPMGRLERGAAADVVLLDPTRRWVYDPTQGFSKSRNSPWAGRELEGRVLATWVGGRLVYSQGRGAPPS